MLVAVDAQFYNGFRRLGDGTIPSIAKPSGTTLASSGSAGNYTLTATVNSSPANPASSGTTVTITDTTNAYFSIHRIVQRRH